VGNEQNFSKNSVSFGGLGLIQLIAASVVGRPLFYFTFDDQTFAQELDESVKLMEDKGVTIGSHFDILFHIHQNKSFFFRTALPTDHPVWKGGTCSTPVPARLDSTTVDSEFER
jgi:hypothetical protein